MRAILTIILGCVLFLTGCSASQTDMENVSDHNEDQIEIIDGRPPEVESEEDENQEEQLIEIVDEIPQELEDEGEVVTAEEGIQGLPEQVSGDDVAEEDTTTYNNQVLRYRFASKKEAKELYLANEEYFAGFSDYDLQYRLQRTNATTADLEEFKTFGADQMSEYTKEEREAINEVMAEMEAQIREEGYTFPSLDEIVFVRTTMAEENGSGAYTHGTQIYFGRIIDRLLSENKKEYESIRTILWHEIFHCMTRCNPDFRKDMYKIIHFTIQEDDFEVPKKVHDISISNPDVEHRNAYATFSIEGEKMDCYTVLIAKKPFKKKGDRFFDCVETALVPIKSKGTYYTPIDTDDFWKIFGKNTNYVIDPEECLADNFGYAMYYGKKGMRYKNPEIIDAIIEYLKK